MKPKIFVSSTFYDLKYIREELSCFIKSYKFEPIMFEDGDVGYTPGKALDVSCYNAMREANMVILVIGGLYGSPASTQTNTDKNDFENFLSVTRKEYQTAKRESIPIYCFIESEVKVEYEVYKLNKENISQIKFRATKDNNVFKFIDEVYSIGYIPINGFCKVNEIKEFLSI